MTDVRATDGFLPFYMLTALCLLIAYVIKRALFAGADESDDRPVVDFLHGRKAMLAACAARLRNSSGLIWVDLGGGAAESVKSMSEYVDLKIFEKIYVVDNCAKACDVARKKANQNGWNNVCVVQADACTYRPNSKAVLITFSYSLSAIPSFMSVIDAAASYLSEDGILGVTDFYTSGRHDSPNRQHSFVQRWFWNAVFDFKNRDLTPQRRAYLEHVFEPVYEYNGRGKIPYIPYLQAPYYHWVGRLRNVSCVNIERFPVRASDDLECSRPSTFPPTFLYSLSWEDPREDDRVLEIDNEDVVLTLTSGGCNALDLVQQGAKQVVAVDMNPAQSYLMELKRVAIMRLPFEDVWQMFGDGVHANFPEILERELAPFLSQGAYNFWKRKQRYFKNGLYYHGGMGRLIRAVRFLAKVTRQEKWIDGMVNAPTLSKQADFWSATVGRWLRQAGLGARIFSFFFTNRVVLWFCAGVCKGQLNLIRKEDNIYSYIVRSFNYVATESHLRDSNYFYRCCLTGKFARHCCPRFLEEGPFHTLKVDLATRERLLIRTTSFVSELNKRMYTKVILMDHVDWLEQADIDILANALQKHVKVGGRIIWRSASRKPHYSHAFEKAGFKVMRIRSSETYMDRVSMYASFYVGIRQNS